jgi:hypothetical protein
VVGAGIVVGERVEGVSVEVGAPGERAEVVGVEVVNVGEMVAAVGVEVVVVGVGAVVTGACEEQPVMLITIHTTRFNIKATQVFIRTLSLSPKFDHLFCFSLSPVIVI